VERPIEGPDPYSPRLTSAEAAKWLGGTLGPEGFDRLMSLHLPTVRPIYAGRGKFWRWMDVAILEYLLGRAETLPPKKRGEDDADGD
jgi:hypothetical protein